MCPNEQEVIKKLEDAANNTKSWKDRVAHHEGLIRLIQPGNDLFFFAHLTTFIAPLFHYNTPFLVLFTLL